MPGLAGSVQPEEPEARESAKGALVVSLWLVQDETTAELMSNWYERMRDGEGRASALRAAQLEI